MTLEEIKQAILLQLDNKPYLCELEILNKIDKESRFDNIETTYQSKDSLDLPLYVWSFRHNILRLLFDLIEQNLIFLETLSDENTQEVIEDYFKERIPRPIAMKIFRGRYSHSETLWLPLRIVRYDEGRHHIQFLKHKEGSLYELVL